MGATAPAITDGDIDAAMRLVVELEAGGRSADAALILKLVAQAEALRDDSAVWESELTTEDVEALERADAGIAAGQIIPDEIVMQGREAVEAYVRRRDAGDVAPDITAAIEAYRRDYDARKRAGLDSA